MTQLTVTLDSAGITDVPGFEAAGVPCDIREKHDLKRLDLALLFSLRPCTAAGTFTKNAVKAAPVLLCQKHLAEGGPVPRHRRQFRQRQRLHRPRRPARRPGHRRSAPPPRST